MDLALVIDKLAPGADYRRADDLATLTETWVDARPVPSEAAINEAWAEIEAAQALIDARKIWPTVADFYAEFTPTEKYLIQSSAIPSIVVARGDLAMWRGDVWSDNPDVLAGLNAMVKAKILTAARRAEILAK